MHIRELLALIPFVSKAGMSVEDHGPGKAVLSLGPDPDNTTAGGLLHGGALFTLAETAASVALSTHPELRDLRIYLRGAEARFERAEDGRVSAHALVPPELAHQVSQGLAATGRGEGTIEVEVLGGHGQLVAIWTGTYRFKLPR